MWEQLLDRLVGFLPRGFPLPRSLTGFSQKALTAMQLAQNDTRGFGLQSVGTEQILLGLIKERTGMAWQFLDSVGVNWENAQAEVEKMIGGSRGETPTEIPLTPGAKEVMELSLEESQQLGHYHIDTGHLLLGLLQKHDSVGATVLENLGVDRQNLEQRLRQALG